MTKTEFIEKRTRPAAEVIADLSAETRRHSYMVGAWVWVEFSTKPDATVISELKAAGFTWNNRRKVWQNPCGVFRPASSDDPRLRYGATPVDVDEEKQA